MSKNDIAKNIDLEQAAKLIHALERDLAQKWTFGERLADRIAFASEIKALAVATDDVATFAVRSDLPCLPLDDDAAVLDYVLARA